MHTARRGLESIQKIRDDAGAIQRRFSNRGRRPHDAAVASHEFCELAPHPSLEQRNPYTAKPVTPWQRH
jgi:hypothetical protein